MDDLPSLIYRALRRTYDEIIRVCTTGTSGPWKRPAVREFDADHIGIPSGQTPVPPSLTTSGLFVWTSCPTAPAGPETRTPTRLRISHTQ
ncbi:hypothetical protein [Streptomyces sp. NPDC004266]|uniref:hypothetical protein n=1 Tax=Streptomyces sp. NPDC004266 TaxID=3364693 RepID=UPI00368344C9